MNGSIEDENAVLRSLLVRHSKAGQQVLRAQTRFAHLAEASAADRQGAIEYIRRRLTDVSADALADFAAKNEEQHDLAAMFDLAESFVLLSDPQIHEALRAGRGWAALKKRCRGTRGVIDCSRVGFDRAVTQALVYFGHQRGARSGAGWYCLLQRSNDNWLQFRRTRAWVS